MDADVQMDEEAAERLRQEERDAEFAARLQEEEEELVREELRKSTVKKRPSRSDSAAAATSAGASKKQSKESKEDSWVSRSDRKKSMASASAQQKSFKRLRKVKDFETESEESEEIWMSTDASDEEADGEPHRSIGAHGRTRPDATRSSALPDGTADAMNADTEDEEYEDDKDDFEPAKPSASKRKQKESVSGSRSNPKRTRASVDGPSAAVQRDSKVLLPGMHSRRLYAECPQTCAVDCQWPGAFCDLWNCRCVRGATWRRPRPNSEPDRTRMGWARFARIASKLQDLLPTRQRPNPSEGTAPRPRGLRLTIRFELPSAQR